MLECDPGAQNLDGYTGVEFAKESHLANNALLQTDASSGNPLADANMVFIPYCTGDAHTGFSTRSYDIDGVRRDTYYWGAKNVQTYLRRLKPTFPSVTRVVLAGTSAGGGGVRYNYSSVRAAFGLRVDSIVDSAPGFATPDTATKRTEQLNEYGSAVSGCPTCSSVDDVHAFNRSLDPASRFAFISFRYDDVTKNDMSFMEFSSAMQKYVTELDKDPEAGAFIIDNSISSPEHVVLTRPALVSQTAALKTWLGEVLSDRPFPQSQLVPGP